MMDDDFLLKVIGIRDNYSVSIKGDVYYVDAYPDEYGSCDIDLRELEIPANVVFENEGDVHLQSLKTLPPGVEFKNGGSVDLRSSKTISPGVEFKNGGSVHLQSLKTIPPGVEFKNKGSVYLGSLIGGWIDDWGGNIEGVDSKRLFNFTISKGVFI